MPYGTYVELTGDSVIGAPAGSSKIIYDRGFTYQSSNEPRSLVVRSGSNSNIKKVRTKGKPTRTVIGYRLVRYRDKKAKKVLETRTFERRIKKVTYVTITYRDKSQKPTWRSVRRHGQLIRRYPVYPLVTKTVPHIRWITVDITRSRWVFPLVERYVPIYAPRKKVPKVKTLRTPSLIPNSLTTRVFKMISRKSSGTTTGINKQNPTVPMTIRGDLWGGLWSYYNLAALTLPAVIIPGEMVDESRYTATINELDRQALNRLYDGVANCGPNLLVALGTYGQTASFIANSISTIAKMIRSARKGDFHTLGSILGNGLSPTGLSNLWLQLQYALKPLLGDINAAIEQFSKTEDLTFDVIRTATKTGSGAFSYYYQNDAPTFRDSRSTTWKVTVRYKARLRVNNAGLRALAQLGMTNPAVLAWEVIPFSFVADWLIPIGKTLENLSAFDGLSVESWHRTVFIQEDTTFNRTFGGVDYNKQFYWGSGSASAVARKIYVNRKVMTTNLPAPPEPRIKNPFSSAHIANALALLTSLRR